MALFLDLHIIPGVVIDDAIEAHKLDLAIQDRYECKCLTLWADESRGQAFCLIEAPTEEAVIAMHNHSHGLIPHRIMQVNSNLVAAFLGRIQDPDSLDEMSKTDIRAFYSDPAFRVLLVTDSMDFKLLARKFGMKKGHELLALKNDIVRHQLKQFEGQEIEMEGKGFVASFITSTQAVQCALAIQKQLHVAAEMMQFRIGLHAGVPVAKSDELFGDTIRYARHLCMFGQAGQVIFSNLVSNLYKEDNNKLQSDKKIRIITPEEESFLEKLIECLSDNWYNSWFDVGKLSNQLYVSNSQLYRKIKATTGVSPNNLLRDYRLIQSLALLKKADNNISQAAFEAGFNSPSYFTKCFQKKFGLKPLDYIKQEG